MENSKKKVLIIIAAALVIIAVGVVVIFRTSLFRGTAGRFYGGEVSPGVPAATNEDIEKLTGVKMGGSFVPQVSSGVLTGVATTSGAQAPAGGGAAKTIQVGPATPGDDTPGNTTSTLQR